MRGVSGVSNVSNVSAFVLAQHIVAQQSVARFCQIQIGHVGQAGLGVGVPFVAVPALFWGHAVVGRGHGCIGSGGGGAVGVVLVDRCPVTFAQAFVVAGGTQTGGGVQTFLKHLFAHFDCFFRVGGVGGVGAGIDGIKDTPMAKPCPYTGWLQRKWYSTHRSNAKGNDNVSTQ